MSSVHENDENLGVHPTGKCSDSEATSDIFALGQPTGRPSILRQSQFENLSNKTVPKGVKVCFQTPRRDPFTKRILSPTKNVKMNSLDECIATLESLKLTSSNESVLQENTGNGSVLPNSDAGGYPDDDMPIQSKGGYQLDFDNLDAIDPFRGSSTVAFSPAQPCVGATVDRSTLNSETEADKTTSISASESEKVLEKAVKPDFVLDETSPFIASLENSVVDTSTNVWSTDSPVIVDQKLLMSQTDQSLDDTEELPKALSPVVPEPEAKPDPVPESESVEKTLPPTRGTYSFDIDDLASVNPFQTGGSKIPNSPALDRKVEPVKSSPPKQDAQEKVESNSPMAESVPEAPVLTEAKAAVVEETPLPPRGTYSFDFDKADSVNPFQTGGSKLSNSPPLDRKVMAVKSSPPKQNAQEKVESNSPMAESVPEAPALTEAKLAVVEETPLPPRGTYSFDFDDLASANPFQTGGSKIPNSPALDRKVEPVKPSPPKQNAQEKVESNSPMAESVPEAPLLTDVKPAVVEETTTSKEAPDSKSTTPADDQVNLLEFNFNDGTEVKRKPPFKKLGKKPLGAKASEKKTAPVEKKPVPPAVEPEPESAPLPKGSYSLDFDKLDDPNFNPFGTKANMGSSQPIPEQQGAAEVDLPSAIPVAMIQRLQNGTKEQPSTENAVSKMEDVKETIAAQQIEAIQPPAPATPNGSTHVQMTTVCHEPIEPDQQNPNLTTIGQDDEFVPGTTFMAGDFDGQIDYLEQFGSSTFQESALRKQSLYLKFDPLLRESPKKGAVGTGVGLSLPRPSLATRMDAQKLAETKPPQSGKADTMKLLDFPAPDVCPMDQDPAVLDLLVPTFKQPLKTEDAIIEVLQYSQKDMDAALAKAQEEAEEKMKEWAAKCDALTQEKEQLGVVLTEFEHTYGQIIAEREQEKQTVQEELKKVLQEKEQALMDLNSMERSFSDLFKRLDKHKEVIEGYKKNEETLKTCAQDYMARIKKEEQRYKSLKAHAEEKISLANGEIADVRAKHRAEVSALQVQLKREQLKVQSLEKSLDQKVKETEELTKLCDELIVNVQKN